MDGKMREEQKYQVSDEMEINIGEILMALAARIPLMLAVGLCTALTAFGVSQFVMRPVYQSTTKIYILNKQDSSSVTYSDLQMGTSLTKDYAELIQSRFVLEEVIQQLNLPFGYEEMKKKVTVSTPADTRILSITVEDGDPVTAMKTANALREAASVHITNVMDIEAVNVVETANMPTGRFGPNVIRNSLIGGLFGVFLVAVIILTEFLLNDTVKTAEDIEKYLNLSTLAMIPMNEGGKRSRLTGKRKARRG